VRGEVRKGLFEPGLRWEQERGSLAAAFLRVFLLFVVTIALCSSCSQEGGRGEGEALKQRPPVEVRAEVDRAVATTGDLIRYAISVDSDPAIEPHIPEVGSEIADLTIVDSGQEGPREVDRRRLVERWYQLRADLVGSYIIPPVTVSYTEKGGEERKLKTSQIFVEVKSVMRDGEMAQDIRGIKSPVPIPRDYTFYLTVAGLVVLVSLMAAGALWFYGHRRKGEWAPPPIPSHELALKELDQLKRDDLIAKGIMREYYFRLSEIFRRYLERRYRFPAVERTTDEIAPDLIRLPTCGEETKVNARHLLEHADLVKFARLVPPREDAEREYTCAVEFVRETSETEGSEVQTKQ
jgi:hypothetical protein